jgi:hypothetical protein
MKDAKQIQQAIQRIELALPRLKEESRHQEMLSIYGILDALNWVLQQPSNLDTLISGCKEVNTDHTSYR